jgi:hypothetical protein
VIATFLALGGHPPTASYLWIGFQVLWLLGRIVAFEALPLGPVKEGPIVSRKWHSQSRRIQHRVIHLIFGLARQQVTTHPRRAMFYQEDVLSALSLAGLFVDVQWSMTPVLPVSDACVEIVAVVGDTLLRSGAWIKGTLLDNSDLYDCSLLLIRAGGQLHAVPSVRVLSLITEHANESNLSTGFDPRGTSNAGTQVHWLLWIPVCRMEGAGQCLELTGTKLLGKRKEGTILERHELEERLRSGILNISLTGLEDVERTLGGAQSAAETLMGIMKDAHPL